MQFNLIRLGVKKSIQLVHKWVAEEKLEEIYLSFDIDALDAQYASATGTAESEGLALDFACEIINSLSKVIQVTGADLVEVAPWINSPIKPLGQLEPATTLNSSAIVLQKIEEQLCITNFQR